MYFINRRPALKLLPFLSLGILIGEFSPQFVVIFILIFAVTFIGNFTKNKLFTIPLCLVAIGFLNHSFLQSTQPIPSHLLNNTQTFKCELISIKQKSQK